MPDEDRESEEIEAFIKSASIDGVEKMMYDLKYMGRDDERVLELIRTLDVNTKEDKIILHEIYKYSESTRIRTKLGRILFY